MRTPSGRFCGNVYALHDEPMPLTDTCHLDTDYRVFLQKAAEHAHGRVRAVAQGVLCSIEEDIRMGRNVLDQEHPIDRRIELLAGTPAGGRRRFFAFTRNAVRQLRRDLVVTQRATNDRDQNLNTVCSSYLYKKTTTQTGVSKFDIAGEDGRPLIYPRRLGEDRREIANRHLGALSPAQRQPILDELEGRLQAEQRGMKPVYDEISFLVSLCKLSKNGKFQPNLGVKVREHRMEREAMRQRARAAAEATELGETEQQREKRLAASQARLSSMRRALGMSHHQESDPTSDESETPSE